MDTYESKIEANKVAWGKLAEDQYRCAPGMAGSAIDTNGFAYYPELEGKLPLVFKLLFFLFCLNGLRARHSRYLYYCCCLWCYPNGQERNINYKPCKCLCLLS